jgi:2-oxoglutarate ferredoxin oxidoreductase subunit gamma
MSETQIRIGGFGGQGVILSAIIVGRAAAIHGGLHATLIQSFGGSTEARNAKVDCAKGDKVTS